MNFKTVGISNIEVRTAMRGALVLFAGALLSLPLYGQQASAGADGSVASASGSIATDQSVSPEVMKELEGMKKRIEQLEAELKIRATAPDVSSSPATPVK